MASVGVVCCCDCEVADDDDDDDSKCDATFRSLRIDSRRIERYSASTSFCKPERRAMGAILILLLMMSMAVWYLPPVDGVDFQDYFMIMGNSVMGRHACRRAAICGSLAGRKVSFRLNGYGSQIQISKLGALCSFVLFLSTRS